MPWILEQTQSSPAGSFSDQLVVDVRRLRELEAENTRLKKMLAERDLEIDVMKDIGEKRGEPRREEASGGACGRTWHITAQSLPAAVGGPVDARLHLALGATRRTSPKPTPARAANHVWSYDFIYDRRANGQQLKGLRVVDEWTRECLAIEASGSIRSGHVIDVLSRLVSVHGAPRFLRSDDGPGFLSRAILRWLASSNIDTAFIDPGKPWRNPTNESFNDKFRDECLSLGWFRSRTEPKVLIEFWRRHYNEVRPHSSLGYLTPREFSNRSPSDHNRAIFPVTGGRKKSGRPEARRVMNGMKT